MLGVTHVKRFSRSTVVLGNDEVEAFAGIKLICERCFDNMKQYCETREH